MYPFCEIIGIIGNFAYNYKLPENMPIVLKNTMHPYFHQGIKKSIPFCANWFVTYIEKVSGSPGFPPNEK